MAKKYLQKDSRKIIGKTTVSVLPPNPETLMPVPYIPEPCIEGKTIYVHEGEPFIYQGPQTEGIVWQSETDPKKRLVYVGPENREMRLVRS